MLGKRLPPRTKKKNAQQGVADDVASFPDVEVPRFESGTIDAEEKMDDRVKEATCVVRGKICG